jgi:TBC1 domain-containing protein 4
MKIKKKGLSFIVGILLINSENDEEKTFELLKHLLIDMGLRKQFKPDMFALQKYMYQMTRLLHDHQSDIYAHLEDNETSATLYCAPWFLTMFASQFDINFVARVFDFLFTEGPVVLFTVALAIMGVHKALLLHCESFEVIVNYLKITVPEMSLMQSDLIIKKAFEYDIKQDLEAYEIEFYIFQEELQLCSTQNETSMRPVQLPSSITSMAMRDQQHENNTTQKQLEQINRKLKDRIEDLLEQLQLNQVHKNNQNDVIYRLEYENAHLKTKIETLEIERIGLLNQLKQNFN